MSAMASAARWFVVSLPPASIIISSYLVLSLAASVRTAAPVSLMLVYLKQTAFF
jgi:hypothetical protein